ncbi:hypothetical protein QCA50_010523 [Cerrena zonata]|uniref:Uncharacterized protein n=1 Tax=Cerrena zonata TaxID=2478898 RepID=A0AAW0G4L9_9APHY
MPLRNTSQPRSAALDRHDISNTTAANSIPSSSNISSALSDELPPAYTAAPDVSHGETSIEFGPARPFQSAPRIPRDITASRVPPQQTGRSEPSWPPPSWAGFPGDVSRQGTGRNPPPRHPQSSGSAISNTILTRAHTTATRPARVSEFARDFYTAGADVDTGLLGGASSQYTTPQTTLSRESSSRQRTTSPRQPEEASTGGVPDDGKPTKTPVPGHPLMRDGKVLVYPLDFDCPKCHNTGFKSYDPSNPHKKCWTKFGKPFTGPITYAAWGSTSPSQGSTKFQRPLPSFKPPQTTLRPSAKLHRPSASLGAFNDPSNPGLSRSSSTSRIFNGYPGASASSQSRVIPTPGGGVPMSPYLDPLQQRGYGSPMNTGSTPNIVSSYGARAPAGAPVVRPGDPRIGGHLCWRCGGKGTVSFLIFDEDTCSICGGLGRTFN